MRLEWCQENKTIVNYRIEFRCAKYTNRWSYHHQYKTLKDAQIEALGLAKQLSEDNIIRVVRYTQIIEILDTQNGCKKP